MSTDKEILNNRQVFHEYIILDKYEAGAVLVGTEVKSIMAGRIQLKDVVCLDQGWRGLAAERAYFALFARKHP